MFPWQESSTSSLISVLDVAVTGIHSRLIELYNTTIQTLSLSTSKELSVTEFFNIIDVTPNNELENLLSLYSTLSEHSIEDLVKTLVLWKDSNPEMNSIYWGTSHLLNVQLQIITDYLFYRVLLSMIFSYSNSQIKHRTLPSDIIDKITYFIFNRVLHSEIPIFSSSPSSSDNSKKSKLSISQSKRNIKPLHPMSIARSIVHELMATTLSIISTSSFLEVVSQFYVYLQEFSSEPLKAEKLVAMMRYLYLPITPKLLDLAKQFVSTVMGNFSKKLDDKFLQSCSKMIGQILLLQAIRFDIDNYDNLQSWHTYISDLNQTITNSTNNFKDSLSELELQVGVLCANKPISNISEYIKYLDKFILFYSTCNSKEDILNDIFYFLIYLFRLFPQDTNATYFSNIVDKLSELFIPKKGELISPDCIGVLADIGALITIFLHGSGFNIIFELMKIDKTSEQQIIGLLMFNKVADWCNISFGKRGHLKRDLVKEVPTLRYIALDNLVTSKNATDSIISIDLLKQYRLIFGQLIFYLDNEIGQYKPKPNMKRECISQVIPNDKIAMLEVFRIALSCVSRIPPGNLKISQLIDLLIDKCFHSDLAIVRESKIVLKSFIQFRPILRVTITESMARYILTLPNDDVIATRFAISILNECFFNWSDIEYMHIPDSDTQYIDIDIRKRKLFRASLYEGVALVLLCSTNIGIRIDAIKLLRAICSLSYELPKNIVEPGIRLLTVIEKCENSIIKSLKTDLFEELSQNLNTPDSTIKLSYSFQSIQDLIQQNNHNAWSNFLGHLIQKTKLKCQRTLSLTFSFLCPILDKFTKYFIPESLQRPRDKIINPSNNNNNNNNIYLWRNYILLASAIGSGDDNTLVAELGIISALQKNQNWVTELILPALFHTNNSYRDAISYVIRYCKAPFVYSIPNIIMDIKKDIYITDTITKDTISKDCYQFEIVKVFAILSERYYEEKETNNDFISSCLIVLMDSISFLSKKIYDTDVLPVNLVELRYNIFKICTFALQRKNNQPVSIKLENRVKLLCFALMHVGFGKFYMNNRDWYIKIKNRISEEKINNSDNPMIVQLHQLLTPVQLYANNSLASIISTTSLNINDSASDKDLLLKHIPQYALAVFQTSKNSLIRLYARNSIMEIMFQSTKDDQAILFENWIKNCYAQKSFAAQEYLFLILTVLKKEGSSDIDFPLIPLLNLAFFKIGDPELESRKCATELLHWLSSRFFRTKQKTFQMQITSQCSSQYLPQLYHMSLEFSILHEELRIEVLQEVLHRISTLTTEGQYRMIIYLSGWLGHFNLSVMNSDKILKVLEELVLLTSLYSEQRVDLLDRLWVSLANTESNIPIIINFMVDTITLKQNDSLLPIFQKICIFMSSSQPLIIFNGLIDCIRDLNSEITIKPEMLKCGTRLTIKPEKQKQKQEKLSLFHDIFPNIEQKLFSKGNFAVAVLGEIIISNIDTSLYVSELLLSALLCFDHPKSIIYESAKILFQNLIFKLITSKVNESSYQVQYYKELVSMLSNSGRESLWNQPEDLNYDNDKQNFKILSKVINLSMKSLDIIDNLNDNFSQLILEKLSQSIQRHYISRCLQIYRNLDIKLSKKSLEILTITYIRCICLRDDKCLLRESLELTDTLLVLIDNTSTNDLIKYPELCWIGVSLLHSSRSKDYISGILILGSLFRKIDLTNDKIRYIYEQSIPKIWNKNDFPGILILLIKGVCSQTVEGVSRTLMTKLCLIPPSIILDKEIEKTMLIFILCLLPGLIAPRNTHIVDSIALRLSSGLEKSKYIELSKLFKDYPQWGKSSIAYSKYLFDISKQIAFEFFPKYELFTFTLLTTMLQNCMDKYKKPVIQIIEALISYIDFSKSSLAKEHVYVFVPLLQYIQGNTWATGLSTLSTLLQSSKQFSSKLQDILVYDKKSTKNYFAECESLKYTWDKPSQALLSNIKISSLLKGVLNITKTLPFERPLPPPRKYPLKKPQSDFLPKSESPIKQSSSPSPFRSTQPVSTDNIPLRSIPPKQRKRVLEKVRQSPNSKTTITRRSSPSTLPSRKLPQVTPPKRPSTDQTKLPLRPPRPK